MKKKMVLIFMCCFAIVALAACSQNNGSTGSQDDIGQDRALEIALEHAGVNESDITQQRVELSNDDGVKEYEVEFYAGNQEYDYDIDAATGISVVTTRKLKMIFGKATAPVTVVVMQQVTVLLQKMKPWPLFWKGFPGPPNLTFACTLKGMMAEIFMKAS